MTQREGESSLLDELLDQAVLQFNSQDNFVNQYGRIEGFRLVHAASKVIEQAENIDEVFDSLTKIRPDSAEEVLATISEIKTWDQFKLEASEWIIRLELSKRDPELEEESRRRTDYWDNLA